MPDVLILRFFSIQFSTKKFFLWNEIKAIEHNQHCIFLAQKFENWDVIFCSHFSSAKPLDFPHLIKLNFIWQFLKNFGVIIAMCMSANQVRGSTKKLIFKVGTSRSFLVGKLTLKILQHKKKCWKLVGLHLNYKGNTNGTSFREVKILIKMLKNGEVAWQDCDWNVPSFTITF